MCVLYLISDYGIIRILIESKNHGNEDDLHWYRNRLGLIREEGLLERRTY